MARRRKTRRRRGVHCKRVRIRGKTRKMCWGPKGKLVSSKRRKRRKSRR